MSNEETKRKLLQKDSFRLAKGLVLLSESTYKKCLREE